MAKRRTLKRDISYIAGELFTEVLVAKMLAPKVDQEAADIVMVRILDMQDEFIKRAASPGGKNNAKLVKTYYKKLVADLQTEVEAIILAIEELNKGKMV
ncbi:hypothetical protein LJC44_00190 [Parabacteroides sp. OttesenSCG-928-G06]|nr:hypothetical protein [Parabacteroides sp. OttesenSCG-928-K15]MDL2281519.1 hypothetical protein [Parabacteroides sp. OttesenSCG-928-G06]